MKAMWMKRNFSSPLSYSLKTQRSERPLKRKLERKRQEKDEKNDSTKKPKISRAQDMFKAVLQESNEHDREIVEQMMAREREMQAAEHSLMREFMGSLSQLLKKD